MIDNYREKTREKMLEDLYAACLALRHSSFYDDCIKNRVALLISTWRMIDRIISRTRDIEDSDLYGRKIWEKDDREGS